MHKGMNGDRSLRKVIKEARKKKPWTQEDLARELKCSRSLIAAIEGGQHPTALMLTKLLAVFDETEASIIKATPEARKIIADDPGLREEDTQFNEDMVQRFMFPRRTGEIDLSGSWHAMWLTTSGGLENRNRETINIRRRWNGTWEFSNNEISEDNPNGGYLWAARMDLFDKRHILGHYCARDISVLAKGTLCLEVQPNGREILGVWNGLNFDTMWAHGLVAMCRAGSRSTDPGIALDRFAASRPKMPY